MSEIVNIRLFVIELQILCSANHPILFKFPQVVVNIVVKELEIVFWTSAVNNNNGDMTKRALSILGKASTPFWKMFLI